MAKKRRPSARKRLTLIQSDESAAAIRARYPRRKLTTVQLIVRAPDKAKVRPTARLCGCRRICVALV
jgi:hypothetical protein